MKIYATILGLLLALPAGVSTVFAQDGTLLQYQRLWDPESPDIEDWQMLGPGSVIIWGEDGEIFIIDRGSAHVLRLSRKGELIEIIGRRGQGPGEFSRPECLAYDRTNKQLWVVDGHFQYSRFRLVDGKYSFHDRFTVPTTWAGTWPNLVVESIDRYWTTGRALSEPENLRTALMGSARIKFVDIEDGILREFGSFWDTGREASWALLESGMQNAGFIHRLNGNRFAWTWMYRPIIEVWSEDGDLLVQRTFEEIPVTPPKSTGQYTAIAPATMGKGGYDREADLLFIRLSGADRGIALFVGLDTETLEEKERYYLEIPGLGHPVPDPKFGGFEVAQLDNVTFMPSQFLVERVNGEIRFFTIDLITRTPAVLKRGISPL